MGRLVTSGAEANDLTWGLDALGTSSGTPTVVTSPVRTGARAWRASNGSYLTTAVAGVLGRTYYFRFYLYIDTAPSSAEQIFAAMNASSAHYNLLLNTDRTVQFRFSTSAIGSASSALALATWYRLEMSWQIGSGASDDSGEFRLEGVSIASETNQTRATVATDSIRLGSQTAATNSVEFYDDVALNDNQGASQNSWPGNGRVVLLLPTSDNSRGSWIAGGGGTTNLWDAIDNTPPIGKVSPQTNTSAITNSVSGATNPNGDFNMTTYLAAGVSGHITVVQMWISHGEDSATGTKTGTFKIVSNPDSGTADNVAQGGTSQFGPSAGGAVGAWGTNWPVQGGTVVYDPVVVLSTAPVARITKTDTGTRAADLTFMGIIVEYVSALPSIQVVNQSVQRAANY